MVASEKKPKILCVDDNSDHLVFLKALLIPWGWELVFAENGEGALEKAYAQPPDLILLDVMMPGDMDGFEVCRRIKADERTKSIPVVMITALQEKNERIIAMEAGADDFLSKPVDKTELRVRLKSLLKVKSLHDKLEESYAKLKELERLKEGLTHMIIHDLNNPLSVVSGNLQLLNMELGASISPKIKADLENALLASRDLTEMIRGILDINKMEEGRIKLKYASFNLYEAAKEVVEQMKVIADGEKKGLSLEPAEGAPIISADRELIKRVIFNLINNAFKFTPSGGFVGVKIFFKQEENVFYVQIRDNGAGIPREYVDKIFDKFVQVENNKFKIRLGHGLGLTFCKLAVEAHGGRIWVESEGLGKGSTFKFTFPLVRG